MAITIIGTSHIAKESVEEIKNAIENKKPDIVAVELDVQRASGLLRHQKTSVSMKDIVKIGVKGFVFVKVGQFVQGKLGQLVGSDPGSEMRTAILEAKKRQLIVAFIDQPIQKTLQEFSISLSWKERFQFAGDIVKGIFSGKKQLQELGLDKVDLKKVPSTELVEKMMKKLKDDYPNVYKTLVDDRNRYMVKQLVKLTKSYPEKNILAVVGAGHKKGMEELLLRVEIV